MSRLFPVVFLFASLDGRPVDAVWCRAVPETFVFDSTRSLLTGLSLNPVFGRRICKNELFFPPLTSPCAELDKPGFAFKSGLACEGRKTSNFTDPAPPRPIPARFC